MDKLPFSENGDLSLLWEWESLTLQEFLSKEESAQTPQECEVCPDRKGLEGQWLFPLNRDVKGYRKRLHLGVDAVSVCIPRHSFSWDISLDSVQVKQRYACWFCVN